LIYKLKSPNRKLGLFLFDFFYLRYREQYEKRIFCILFTLLCLTGISQWHILAVPTTTMLPSNPLGMRPLANGKIAFYVNHFWSPSSGTYCRVYISDNDLLSNTSIAGIDPAPSFMLHPNISSVNAHTLAP